MLQRSRSNPCIRAWFNCSDNVGQQYTFVAKLATIRKVVKYAALEDQYIFQPISAVSRGPQNCDARKFLAAYERRSYGNHFSVSTHFCFAISVQFCLLRNSFELDDHMEHQPFHSYLALSTFLPSFSRRFKKTSSPAVAERPHDALCLSVVSSSNTIRRAQSSVISRTSASDLPLHKLNSVQFCVFTDARHSLP